MKKVMIVIGGIGLGVCLLGSLFFLGLNQAAQSVAKEITVDEIHLEAIEDGIYNGRCVTDMVCAEVEVVVEHQQICEIRLLEHKCGEGYKAEVILDQFIEGQTVMVDNISGATLSSLVLKKAVANALESGGNKE